MVIRKRETDRIERENHAFAKRLFDKQAVLKKECLDKAYMDHIKYRKQIAKLTPPHKRLGVGKSAGRIMPHYLPQFLHAD